MTIAKVQMHKGVPTLFINDTPYSACTYFFCVPIEKYIKKFRDAGVKIHTWGWSATIPHSMDIGWYGPGRYNYDAFDKQVEKILKADPQAYLFPRLAVSPPFWWYDLHHDEMCTYDSGEREGVSMASKVWRKEAGEALVSFIKHVRRRPYKDNFIGYQITGGRNEWFYTHRIVAFPDYSKPMLLGFREWLRGKYEDDASALRSSWNIPDVDFDNATLPTRAERMRADLNLFKNPSVSRRVSDYYEFHNDSVAEALIHFCKLGKEITNNESLFGAFYGYMVSAAGFPSLPQHWGHQALKKVIESNYVDFLCAPYGYSYRGPGGVDRPQAVIDSVRLRGKLWFTECDPVTFLASTGGAWQPGRAETLNETIGVIKRDFGNVLTRGDGMWWMDIEMQGGRYDHPEVMDCISRLKRIADGSLDLDRTYKGGIAVIVDEQTPFYMKPGFELTYPLIYMQIILGLSWIGTPYDIYLHDDLSHANFPDYKLYVFLNTFYLTKDEREAVKKRVQRNNSTVVWMYAPGFIGEDGFSTENMRDLTGMSIAYREANYHVGFGLYPLDEPLDGCPQRVYLTNFDHPITRGIPPHTTFGTDTSIGPIFYCNDPEAVTLGRLITPHASRFAPELPVFCVKEFKDWKSIFVGVPNVPSNVLRSIAKYAGVHVYSDYDDVVYANYNFLAVHTKHPGERTIRLPKKCDVYDLFKEEFVAKNANEFTVDLRQYETALYFLGDIKELYKNK